MPLSAVWLEYLQDTGVFFWLILQNCHASFARCLDRNSLSVTGAERWLASRVWLPFRLLQTGSPYLHRRRFRNQWSCRFFHRVEDSTVKSPVGRNDWEKGRFEPEKNEYRSGASKHKRERNDDGSGRFFHSRGRGHAVSGNQFETRSGLAGKGRRRAGWRRGEWASDMEARAGLGINSHNGSRIVDFWHRGCGLGNDRVAGAGFVPAAPRGLQRTPVYVF